MEKEKETRSNKAKEMSQPAGQQAGKNVGGVQGFTVHISYEHYSATSSIFHTTVASYLQQVRHQTSIARKKKGWQTSLHEYSFLYSAVMRPI